MTPEQRQAAAAAAIRQICEQYGIEIVPQIVSEFVNGEQKTVGVVVHLRPVANWNPPNNMGAPKETGSVD